MVGATSDLYWRSETEAERWPVGLVAFHIARGFQRQAEFIELVRDRGGPHRFSWDETHALNAEVAEAHPAPVRDEVIELARASVARMASALAAMDDGSLERPAFG